MGLKKLIHNYTEYNSWANSKIVEWLQTIDEKLLYEESPSSFNSLYNTIQHILRIQKFWVDFVSGKDVSNFDWSVKTNQAQNNLEELKQQSNYMTTIFLALSENDLVESIELNMPWARNQLSRYEYILHAINHSTFHRGQIITIARGLGIILNIPSTDYNFFNVQGIPNKN